MTTREKRVLRLILVALTFAVGAAHVATSGTPVFPVDDAYITAHNAATLTSGEERNFRDVPAVFGATSPAHLLLVSALGLAMPIPNALLAAAWIAVLLYVLGLAELSIRTGASLVQTALVVLVGFTAGLTLHQLFNGLETGLAMAGATWALALSLDPGGRLWPRFLLYSQLPFLRPELTALSALLLARELVTSSPRSLVRPLAVFVLGATPWLLWCFLATGLTWPSSIETKRLYFADGCRPAWNKLASLRANGSRFVSTLGIASAGFALALGSAIGRVGLGFGVCFLTAYFVSFPSALGHYEQRYLYVLVPIAVAGFASLASSERVVVRRVVTGLMCATLFQSSWRVPETLALARENRDFTRNELESLGRWTETNLPSDALLLVHDIGYLSFATHFELVDLVGLKNKTSSAMHRAYTWPSCGDQRYAAIHRTAVRTLPDYLIVLQGWDAIYGIVTGLSRTGWRLHELRGPMSDEQGAYHVFRLEPPKGLVR